MLLEDAASAEQVANVLAGAHGEAEANELREDIEDKLRDVVRWYGRHGGEVCEYEDFDLADAVVDNEKFLDAIIEQSPAEYDLRLLDRDDLQERVNATAQRKTTSWRPALFDWGQGRSGRPNTSGFSFDVPSQMNCWISDRHFPENYEFIPSEFAEKFWDDLKSEMGISDWAEATDRIHENQGWADGEEITIGVGESDFAEWCRDLISEHINKIAEKNPNEVRAMFRSALREGLPRLAARFVAAQPNDDDVLDLAVKWFSGDQSEVRSEIEEWLDIVESPEGEAAEDAEREVVVEVAEDDLRKLGITTGTLWEERPWKLIKLEPKDLPSEGTSMRHCVGSKGMKYLQAVQNGEIEIWSLRSKDNKPRFTLEVDESFYRADNLSRLGHSPAGPDEFRARAIKQVKGKANRLPGYADAYGRSKVVRFPEEVQLWAWIFDQLEVNAADVEDFVAFRAIVNPSAPLPPQPNTGEACVGFDVPYRPLKR